MAKSRPIDTLCIYRIRKGKEKEFKAILRKHWPTLRKAELTTRRKPTIWRGQSQNGKSVYIELFQWKNTEAVGAAHALPEVMAVWEPMGALTEGMEFIDVEEDRI